MAFVRSLSDLTIEQQLWMTVCADKKTDGRHFCQRTKANVATGA
ncbi:hypothetical protein SS05631_a44500 (plasmid) [Sinorhizobium sp. CCBAU 05631]|nr:hypothetical protein SS05631_a44500 [Sinorhizobium sp. CCBAU 05631]